MATFVSANGVPWLLLMKGSPGTGKSAVAQELGRRLRWPVIDKDDVRDLLPDELGGVSYEAMLAIARRQLQLGLSVIADSPMGYRRGYRAALSNAAESGAQVVVVETICSDAAEWLARIRRRAGCGLPAHHATSWEKVEAFLSRSATDPFVVDEPHVVVDTAGRQPPEVADQVVEHLSSLTIEIGA